MFYRPLSTVETFIFSTLSHAFSVSRRLQPVRIVRGHYTAELGGRETVVRHRDERENGTTRRTSRRVHRLLVRALQTGRDGGVQRSWSGPGKCRVRRSRRLRDQGNLKFVL